MIPVGIAIVGKILTGGLLDKVFETVKLYQQGKITEAELKNSVEIAAKEAEVRIEQSWAENNAKIVSSIQSTIRSSKVIQKAYAITLFSQVFVLVWYQLGVPAFNMATGAVWPAPGASIEWAYLLIGAMIGAGPLVYKK